MTAKALLPGTAALTALLAFLMAFGPLSIDLLVPSLPEIGQLLRHRRILTTAIYAKVDRDTLRTIARPWPGDAA